MDLLILVIVLLLLFGGGGGLYWGMGAGWGCGPIGLIIAVVVIAVLLYGYRGRRRSQSLGIRRIHSRAASLARRVYWASLADERLKCLQFAVACSALSTLVARSSRFA
jgi:hypothetical protein